MTQTSSEDAPYTCGRCGGGMENSGDRGKHYVQAKCLEVALARIGALERVLSELTQSLPSGWDRRSG